MMINSALPTIMPVILPAKAKGYNFTLHDKRWVLDKNTTISIGVIHDLLEPETLSGFLHALSFYAMTLSAAHTENIFVYFLSMIRTTQTDHIDDVMLINYRSTLDNTHEYRLGTIRGFLRRWNRLGYPGVSKNVISMLDSWTIKGNRKGDAVKRKNPHDGPLTDNELQAFNEGIVRAYELNMISLSELAISLSISNTGRRPIQISHLRVIDVLCGKNNKGEPFYMLNVPRGKQGDGFRASFKPFAMRQELWAILSAQAKNAISLVEQGLGFELQEFERQQIPLFPDLGVVATIHSPNEFRRLFDSDKLHIAAVEITDTLQFVAEAADIKSERTGEVLNINARRFRYTTGTRAAREGFGELVIAELLDHQDTQNAGIYIKNIPEHVKKLDAAVGFQLARYAQAFVGILVDSEELAERGDNSISRIRTDMGQGVGTCGEHGFCGANVPIPCYTCMHFQPWLDAPHEEVYQALLDERERVKDVTGDIEIAAVLDRSIIAVADVIMRCAKRREELGQHGVNFNG
ncbi:site-specific integrase [Pantoea ananatis]|uniref:site-specific integrase n=1 Tax=Pantoea ananas TaxID=553 RepID=UPI0032EADB71